MDAIEEEKALLSWSRDPSPPAARKQLGNSSLCTIVHVVMVLMEVAVGVLLLYHSNYRSATALARKHSWTFSFHIHLPAQL